MSDEKEDDKNPFITYSLEEIMQIEAGHYFIQIGTDVFSEEGKMAFSRDRAEHLYDGILEDLTLLSENGNEIQQADAKACLLFLQIHSMRIH
jgi:hypothetical protein